MKVIAAIIILAGILLAIFAVTRTMFFTTCIEMGGTWQAWDIFSEAENKKEPSCTINGVRYTIVTEREHDEDTI